MFITILVFFLVLSFLVFIHELGHFLMAKKIGVGVEEFGFGLPPMIWGKKIGRTTYSINWLPIGGFVRLLGEDSEETANVAGQTSNDHKRYFWARSKKERSAILLAGVTMNFLFAVVIISYIFTKGIYVPTDRVHIEKVMANSPAAISNLKPGDVILNFGTKTITTTQELMDITALNSGTPVQVTILRNGEKVVLSLTPRQNPPADEGPLGVVISNMEEKKYPVWQAPFYGTMEALKMSYLMLATLGGMLWKMVTFQKVSWEVAGPVGIAQATGQAVKYGFTAVLQLMGLLSLNLAIVNILPIPALDGGRLLFVLMEKIIGRKVKPKAERIAHQIGMAFLLSLIILVTINDIVRLIRG